MSTEGRVTVQRVTEVDARGINSMMKRIGDSINKISLRIDRLETRIKKLEDASG